MALARPRGEQQEEARPAVASHRVPFTGVEAHERTGAARLGPAARLDDDLAVDHHDPGVLLHLVVAERLAGVEHDQDGARRNVGVEDGRTPCSGRSIDRTEIPALHEK